ncbi:mRNA splicing protein SMB1 [Kluyveromyces lactis]|uniref:Sm protein B n=1 Tax=Kluyveromyces lactis (strain ATCC 8585 / CBS 2359 / DSM 70799 / NBRC 1267 / NRRL Y-1140 / WM37) TaxID=284590 RepID=Q6CWY1_KLULA|nr:uncharacterized protein KLLA0_B00627g [Kluyveromyces lactis]CAH01951.1 KLLA0B00627p [Kluyveromyces lactis]|eukprot:XP_451558.1 uncharacterized protein KLLA0_B00627g [Kluyveromyces lactis]
MSQVEVKKKETKLSDLIDYRIRVATHDGRVYIGQLMAFDAYMNLVMGDCVEERMPHKQIIEVLKSGGNLSSNVQVERRTFGLIILRGEHVLSTSVESPPQLSKKERIEVQKKNAKKLDNAKKARQGKTSNKMNVGTNGSNITSTNSESSNRVTKPSHKPINTNSGAPSRFNSNSQVRPSRFQAPPGFKKRN